MTKTFKFKAKVWIYPGPAGWHFVTLPKDTSEEIDFYFSMYKRGWGSLPVEVTVGQTTWKTSIFMDKKEDSYILPLKSRVRKKEMISEGNKISSTITIKAG